MIRPDEADVSGNLQLCPVLQLLIHTSGLVDLDHCWQESFVSADARVGESRGQIRIREVKRVRDSSTSKSITRRTSVSTRQTIQISSSDTDSNDSVPGPIQRRLHPLFPSRHQTFVHPFLSIQSFLFHHLGPAFRLVHHRSILSVAVRESFPSSSVRMLVAVATHSF